VPVPAAPAALAALAALALTAAGTLGPAAAAVADPAGSTPSSTTTAQSCDAVDTSGSGTPAALPVVSGTPWSLDRFPLGQLHALAQGKGVTVAVIDTGVAAGNAQLTGAVLPGKDEISGDSAPTTTDPVGHGTEVAGIIAARPVAGTGFTGIAPEAKILSIRASDSSGDGNSSVLAKAVEDAVAAHAQVVNISQDVQENGTPVAQSPSSPLGRAVADAVAHDVVVVAAAGNEGLDEKTYPAAFPGVLAVGASDYNDERASFSEEGDFVGVAAPGVDMVTTWPGGGQCSTQGTSFAAPYVAGVAALIRQLHPDWTARQVITRIEQSAQRPGSGRDPYIGWGVVDPVAAVSDSSVPGDAPTPDPSARAVAQPVPVRPFYTGESPDQRDQRLATYVLSAGLVLTLLITGGAVVLRDAGRRRKGTGTT